MSIIFTILIFNIVGSLGAWQSDIDINRVRLIQNEKPHHRQRNPHNRRSIINSRFNDNDYYSIIGPDQPRSRSQTHVSDTPSAEPKALKVYQPREDPRLFYQSDTYVKEINENNLKYLNNEMTAIYPGKDMIQASENVYYRKPSTAQFRQSGTNDVVYDNICVTCPHDRTIVAKPGSDRVILQHPRLKSCYGYRAPREVKFVPMYGPEFGSLIQKGTYGILGQIKYKNNMLRYCYITVHVLIQTCALPKYLIADCGDGNKTCSFACRDPNAELHGASALTCGSHVKWMGKLPVCLARSWCKPPPPPSHGRVSCKGKTVNGWGLAEGAICRLKCARGWKSNTRPIAVCSRSVWSHDFICTNNSNMLQYGCNSMAFDSEPFNEPHNPATMADDMTLIAAAYIVLAEKRKKRTRMWIRPYDLYLYDDGRRSNCCNKPTVMRICIVYLCLY